jgi:hypothetical protein
MLAERIIGTLTFRKEVYAQVEEDKTFTATAWLLVIVVSFLAQLGRFASLGFGHLGRWLLSAVVGTIFAVIGFGVGAFVTSWIGKVVFKADVDWGEMVRTLGLAYVWNAVGLIGVISAIFGTLSCLAIPIAIVAALLGLGAWLIAAKEALDLEWAETLITVVLGWIATWLITFGARLVLG